MRHIFYKCTFNDYLSFNLIFAFSGENRSGSGLYKASHHDAIFFSILIKGDCKHQFEVWLLRKVISPKTLSVCTQRNESHVRSAQIRRSWWGIYVDQHQMKKQLSESGCRRWLKMLKEKWSRRGRTPQIDLGSGSVLWNFEFSKNKRQHEKNTDLHHP